MKAYGLLIAAAVVAVFVFASTYVISEVEQVVITQFGKPIGDPIRTPGLHWKVPFVQKVNRFDKRWLEWDGSPQEMPTREKTYILVDVYARWRIADPLKFFTSVTDERGAQTRLDDIIGAETRNVIAANDLIEVVRSSNRGMAHLEAADDQVGEAVPRAQMVSVGRAKITSMILEKVALVVPEYGIELVDVQFQRVNYTDSVRRKVFERMVAERQRIAARYRSEGEGKSAEILGRKERELKNIESDAYRQVQEIKGRADAKATAVYAEAHNRDPEFYKFTKSLETYKQTIDGKTLAVFSTDSDYFAHLAAIRD